MPDVKKLGLQDAIDAKVEENFQKGFPYPYVFCGNLEDIEDQINELSERYRNLRIIDGKLWYRCVESIPHETASKIFGRMFSNGMRTKPFSNKFEVMVPSPIIFNKFSCGNVQMKIPDAALSFWDNQAKRLDPIAVVEVVFGHESFEEMILELASYLTEFGSSRYSLGFQFLRNSIDFKILFFVLKRRREIDLEKQKVLENFYKENGNKKFPDEKCIKIQKSKVELTQPFLDNLDCEIIFLKEFNENNYTEDFFFSLDIPINQNSDETESVEFCITSHNLVVIRERYREWFNRYRRP